MKAAILAVGMTFTACTNDTLPADGTIPLPDDAYPLRIVSATLSVEENTEPQGANTPLTRVSDYQDGGTHKSKWDGGEVINVRIGDGEVGTYQIIADGNIEPISQCYWQNTDPATVNAWYSNISGQNTDDNTVDLSNQQNGLAYVLKATYPNASYNTPTTLSFTHQLAKVRVKLEGEKATSVNGVQVKGYTSCVVTDGDVSGGPTEDYVQMRENKEEGYYEANLVPMTGIKTDDFIKLNGNVQASVTDIDELVAGKMYTITVNVEGKDVTITDDYTINGNHKPLIIAGNGTITFKDASITSDDRPAIKINDGCSPTLVFEGTNVLKGSITSGQEDEYNIRLENGAKLAVISEGTPIGSTYYRIRLKISGNGKMWVQSNGHDSPAIIVKNGSLDVSDGVDLTAVSTNISWGNIGNLDYIPAIGRAAYVSGVTGGEITLSNCTLKLYAWAKGDKEPQNWVTLENGTVTPDVDGALKSAEWDTEVSLDNNVKVMKLKDRPQRPNWAN